MSGPSFLIADTFTASLGRLTRDEQRAAKTTAFDLQMNPAGNGLSFHKLDRAKDKNFWSIRVSADIRIIVHKTTASLLLCYVDHHDRAYQWAERRKLETHPTTGAAQLVEIRERVEESKASNGSQMGERPARLLFSHMKDEDLLGWGVPLEWLADVRKADEDGLLAMADHLPAEAAEALLELATGGTPTRPVTQPEGTDPFTHPDAQRRFKVFTDSEELQRALEFPWDRWSVFLHPTQKQVVERNYSGPARVSGSAGTGKTIVALHRAAWLLRNRPDARVLLTTFSDPLANALKDRMRRLVGSDPRLAERIDIESLPAVGRRLYSRLLNEPKVLPDEKLRLLLQQAASQAVNHRFQQSFLLSEWYDLVDAWQLGSWEAYRDVKRLGRKTRLSEAQRNLLWSIFSQVQKAIKAEGLISEAGIFTRLAEQYSATATKPYEHVVVDEAQDLGVAQLRFLAAIGSDRADCLFFAGDTGQRIFQTPVSWKSLGIDIRGRSRNLTVNYRTSHQIRQMADRLLAPEVSDLDGNTEQRKGTISVFNGVEPEIRQLKSPELEAQAVSAWLHARLQEGIPPQEIGIFVRSQAEISRARDAAHRANIPYTVLDERLAADPGTTSVSTMHLAKGLEFKAAVVMACDEDVLPLQARIADATDESDIVEIQETERHLFYVACTRARDALLVTSGGRPSEYIEDLGQRQ